MILTTEVLPAMRNALLFPSQICNPAFRIHVGGLCIHPRSTLAVKV